MNHRLIFGRHNARKKGNPKVRYSVRNVSREGVLKEVREELKRRIAEYEFRRGKAMDCFTAEEVAAALRLKFSKVHWAIHKLNLEGLCSQQRNHAPHDSTRDRWGGGDSAWSPTYYDLNVTRRFDSLYAARPLPSPRPTSPKGTFPAWDERPKRYGNKGRYSKRLHRRLPKKEKVEAVV